MLVINHVDRMLLYILVIICFAHITVTCSEMIYSNTNQWPNRSTIVHLFEWKWKDIEEECERFLAPRGFGGVQISPPSENIIIYNESDISKRRPWWERYQVVSYKLITRSGNEDEFQDMVKNCNDVGVRIYADVALNHMTGPGMVGRGTGGSFYDPEKYSYPEIPYTRADFHYPPCHMDFNDAVKVRQCELLGLKDLNQSVENVRNIIVNFLNKLIDYGVAGFRIDAAKHMWPKDLKMIYNRLNYLNVSHGFEQNTRPYIYQEIALIHPGDVISREEYTDIAPITEFKVGAELGRSFRGNNPLKWLKTWGPQWGLVNNSKDALVFIDNHDNQREVSNLVLTYREAKAYKAAVAFLLAHPYGSPRIMSSFKFQNFDIGPPIDQNYNILTPSFDENGHCNNGWVCEHRWMEIYQMVAFRNVANNSEMSNWWDNGNNQFAFCRGENAFIAVNIENADLNQNIYTCLPQGTYCDIISGKKVNNKCTGKYIVVDENKYSNVKLNSNDVNFYLAIHVGSESRLPGKVF